MSGLFSKVNVSTSRDKNKLELTYDLEFVKPMKNSNIIVFTSDRTGNPRVCNILNVWEVNSGSDIISSADPTPKFITTEKSECRESLKKIIRISDGSGVCVKPITAEKLIERNWAIPSE